MKISYSCNTEFELWQGWCLGSNALKFAAFKRHSRRVPEYLALPYRFSAATGQILFSISLGGLNFRGFSLYNHYRTAGTIN